jgi:hypothetical protein
MGLRMNETYTEAAEVDEQFCAEAARRYPNDPTAVQRLLAEREAKANAALRYRRRRSYATGFTTWSLSTAIRSTAEWRNCARNGDGDARLPSARRSSNRDNPSDPSTTASPSMVKLLALMRRAAVAMADSRAVQSRALRTVEPHSRTVPADDHAVAVMLDFVDPGGPGRRS